MADSALVKTNSANSTLSPPTSRRKAIAAILTKIAVCARQPLPEDEVLDFHAAVFDEALSDVPTDRLETVYRQAIRQHGGAFPLTTGEILDAWRDIRQPGLPLMDDVYWAAQEPARRE